MAEKCIFSVVIPTRNRTSSLTELVKIILQQSVLPTSIVIVDSSDNERKPLEYLNERIKHIYTNEKSIAKQKNIGLSSLKEMTSVVFFLDDDTRPDLSYFENMLKTLKSSNAVGVSGLALNPNKQIKRYPFGLMGFVRRIFLLESKLDGVVLKSGIGIPVRQIKSGLKEVEWLIGCSCWDLNKVKNIEFEKDFEGYSLGEDLIFSVRAKKLGKLVVNSDIVLEHLEMEQNNSNLIEMNFMWTYYRFRVSRYLDHKLFFYLGFFWSLIGRLLASIIIFCVKPKKSINQIMGIVKGLVYLVKSRFV